MTRPGDSDIEMPSGPWPPRPDVRAFDALLAGTRQPEEAPAELRAVADVLTALRAPADRREVASWGQALLAYRESARAPEAPSRSHRRRPRRASPLSPRLAAAACVAALAILGGGIAAAYTASLPSTTQNSAAPNAQHNPAATATDSSVGALAAGSKPRRAERTSRGTERTSRGRSHASQGTGSTSHAPCHPGQVAGPWLYPSHAAGGASGGSAYCVGYRIPHRSAPPHPSPSTSAGHSSTPTTKPSHSSEY
jgi:hypothetical protein